MSTKMTKTELENELKAAQRRIAELQHNEAHYRALVETLGISLCRWLPDTTLTYANDKYKSIFGISGDPRGKKWLEFLPDETRDSTTAYYQELAENPRLVAYEHPVTVEDGQTRDYQWIDIPVFDMDGALLEFQSVGMDITERKHAEKTASYAEKRYQSLFENSPIMNLVAEINGQRSVIIDCNQTFLSVLGFNKADVVGKPIDDFYTKSSLARYKEKSLVSEALKGNYISAERELRCSDGRVITTLAKVYMVAESEDGRAAVMQISFADVSDQKETYRTLREGERQMQALVTSLDEIVFEVDERGTYINVWTANEGMLIRPRSEVIGKTLSDFFSEEQSRPFYEVMGRILKGGPSENVEYFIDTPVGRLWFSARFNPVRAQDGSVKTASIMVRDITHQKQVEDELKTEQVRFDKLVAAVPGAICTFHQKADGTLCVPFATKAFEEIYGLPLDAVENDIEAMVRRIPPDNLHSLVEAVQVSAETMQPWRNEYLYNHPTKGMIWIEGYSMPVRNEDGTISWYGISTDVTERKQSELAMRELENKFQTLVEQSPVVVYLDEVDGPCHYLSPQLEKILGYTPAEFISDPGLWDRLIHPEDFPLVEQAVKMGARTHQRIKLEYRICARDGQELWVHDEAEVLPDSASGQVILQGLFYDITERKIAEIALRASEKRLRSLVDSQTHFLLRTDVLGKFTYWNNKYVQEFSWLHKHKDLRNSTPMEAICEHHHARVREVVEKCLTHPGQVFNVELDKPAKDGGIRTSLWEFVALTDENNQPSEIQCMGIEITELKKAQNELVELNRSLEERVRQRTMEVQDLYENAPIGYHSVDSDGTIVRVNQTHLDWLGYTREEFLGRPISRFMTAASIAHFQSEFPQFIKTGSVRDVEVDMICKDGSTIPVLISASAIYDEEKNFIMTRTTVFDNTGRRAMEEALRQSRDELSVVNQSLENAARLKDEFLASMSHELRTPLTGILGLSETMQLGTYGPCNEKQTRAIKSIEESGRHLLDLINDILDLSKIEAAQLEIQVVPVPLSEICQASLQLTKGMANKKRQRVHSNVPVESVVVDVDPRRFKQVLVNLLSNAIKFTPEGGELGLDVTLLKSEGKVQFVVWDKGIGIKPEDKEKLFKPFIQIDSSLARQYAGTGLGLSLVRRLVELHNGTVDFESTFGLGSRFIVTLPWTSTNKDALNHSKPESAPDMHPASDSAPAESGFPTILLADDNDTVLELVVEYLASRKFRPIPVRSGYELLDKLESVQPKLLLVDIQMPGMDGLETIRRIRHNPVDAVASIPIIALTALSMPGDRERCVAAGANEYVSKPVKLTELENIIKGLLGRS